jgi:hypothetical protein
MRTSNNRTEARGQAPKRKSKSWPPVLSLEDAARAFVAAYRARFDYTHVVYLKVDTRRIAAKFCDDSDAVMLQYEHD